MIVGVKSITIEHDDLVGNLLGFPPEIVELMIREQISQGNKPDVSVFQEKIDANFAMGGFRWSRSSDGISFWSKIINAREFDIFYEKYGIKNKSQENLISEKMTEEPKIQISDVFMNEYESRIKTVDEYLSKIKTGCTITVNRISGKHRYIYLNKLDGRDYILVCSYSTFSSIENNKRPAIYCVHKLSICIEEEKIELSLNEISKKFGIPVHLIKIKEKK